MGVREREYRCTTLLSFDAEPEARISCVFSSIRTGITSNSKKKSGFWKVFDQIGTNKVIYQLSCSLPPPHLSTTSPSCACAVPPPLLESVSTTNCLSLSHGRDCSSIGH